MTPRALLPENDSADIPCTVCGREAGDGLGCFLVVENAWFDRLTILRWDTTLAERAEMRAVCCKQHLRSLLTHWLTCANLQFTSSDAFRLPATRASAPDTSGPRGAVGAKVVGELAVSREAFSRAWSGSPQTLDCILDALLDGLTPEVAERTPPEAAGELAGIALPERPLKSFQEYAFQN